MKKWDVLKSEHIFQNPVCTLRVDKCLLPNGKVIDNYLVNEYADWVNIVALTPQKEMVLVKQYRHGCEGCILEIPGGVADENEDIHSAVARELREETGYVSENKPVLIGSFYTNPANATNQVHTFLITDAEKKYDQCLDETEDIEIVIYPFEKVEKMIRQGGIKQLFTAAAYYMVKNYLENP